MPAASLALVNRFEKKALVLNGAPEWLPWHNLEILSSSIVVWSRITSVVAN
jgi:hypothetical protein